MHLWNFLLHQQQQDLMYSYVQNNSSVFKTTEKKFHVPNSIYFNTYKGTRSSTHSIPHEKMNFFFKTENKEKDYSAVQKNSSICIFIYELEYLQYKL